MIGFSEYMQLRKLDHSMNAFAHLYAENQGITVDQAKQQILALFDQINGADQASLTAKLTFMNDLLTKGAQALPELQKKYQDEYPNLQKMQQGQDAQANGQPNQQQPVSGQQQQQPQPTK